MFLMSEFIIFLLALLRALAPASAPEPTVTIPTEHPPVVIEEYAPCPEPGPEPTVPAYDPNDNSAYTK